MKNKALLSEVRQLQKIAGVLKENKLGEAGVQWTSKLNPEVNGIEIYNDGDNRLFVIFDKNTGGLHVINDWNGEDYDEVWGSDGDVRPDLLAQLQESRLGEAGNKGMPQGTVLNFIYDLGDIEETSGTAKVLARKTAHYYKKQQHDEVKLYKLAEDVYKVETKAQTEIFMGPSAPNASEVYQLYKKGDIDGAFAAMEEIDF